jgi:hypothetical protein
MKAVERDISKNEPWYNYNVIRYVKLPFFVAFIIDLFDL